MPRQRLSSVAAGRKRGQLSTGCGGYLFGKSGQRMKVEVVVFTYLGGAAQRWQRLSGKGRGEVDLPEFVTGEA
ncbi:MAG TPA: hypothetical protein VKE49_13020 [Myxococcaceae bacterium]|nr:hypothetical protein [Myxococcaceae bacterium]